MTLTALPLSIDSDAIATLTIEPNQGPMVVLDEPLIQRLNVSLRALPANLAGLILASGSPRVFIAGADLKSIDAMSHEQLDAYLSFGQETFVLLCRLPYPTAAAINGAALGGGLELAMHCDALICAPAPMRDAQPAKPYPVGLPEAGLSICPGWGGTNLLPARTNPAEAIRRTATGQTWLLNDAISAGLFDVAAPDSASLLATAKSWLLANRGSPARRRDGLPLRWIGRPESRNQVMAGLLDAQDVLGPSATAPAAACLSAVRAGLDRGWLGALELERRELNRLRAEPAGKAAISAFLSKGSDKGAKKV